MPEFKISIFTGPTLVGTIAEKLREAENAVLVEGTEKVIVESSGSDHDGAAWNVLVALVRKHGTDFGPRPRAV